jgi:hypothetical protein
MALIYVLETGVLNPQGIPLTKVGFTDHPERLARRYGTYYPAPVVRKVITLRTEKPRRTEWKLHRYLGGVLTGSGELYLAHWQAVVDAIERVLTTDGRLEFSWQPRRPHELKSTAVALLLGEHPDWSYAVIARQTGVSRQYVKQVHDNLTSPA